MNPAQLSRLARFVELLNEATRETGIRVHHHGVGLELEDIKNEEHEAAPFVLNVDFKAEAYSLAQYVIEARP